MLEANFGDGLLLSRPMLKVSKILNPKKPKSAYLEKDLLNLKMNLPYYKATSKNCKKLSKIYKKDLTRLIKIKKPSKKKPKYLQKSKTELKNLYPD